MTIEELQAANERLSAELQDVKSKLSKSDGAVSRISAEKEKLQAKLDDAGAGNGASVAKAAASLLEEREAAIIKRERALALAKENNLDYDIAYRAFGLDPDTTIDGQFDAANEIRYEERRKLLAEISGRTPYKGIKLKEPMDIYEWNEKPDAVIRAHPEETTEALDRELKKRRGGTLRDMISQGIKRGQ